MGAVARTMVGPVLRAIVRAVGTMALAAAAFAVVQRATRVMQVVFVMMVVGHVSFFVEICLRYILNENCKPEICKHL